MLYLISDIHGDLKAFKKILKMTGFDRSKDHMIVMGIFLTGMMKAFLFWNLWHLILRMVLWSS